MRLRSVTIVLLLVSLASAASGEVKHEKTKERWTPAQVLVKYKSGFAPTIGTHGVKRAKKVFGQFQLRANAMQRGADRGLDRVYLLELERDEVEKTLAALADDPRVEYAEPNWRIEFAAVPNDPSFGVQWGLTKIGAPQAWDSATSGTGVVIGVVDTGIDMTHPDLAASLWTNPGEIAGNGIDDDGNGFVDDVHGWDFYYDDADPTDENGHGTRVAGIIGAAGNNATGISGVVWTSKLAVLKIGNAAFADAYSAVRAIEYANMMGIKITNNSWGWSEGGQSFLLDDVVNEADAAGYLFVAAAGNDAKDNDQLPEYPSHYENSNVVSVTATTSSDTLSSYANWGATSVDLAAPGDSIESTAFGGGYQSASGTSFSTPFVSGAAALLWTANPAMTAAQIRDRLLLTSEPSPSLHGRTVSGGRLSLANLFDAETVAPAAITDLTVIDSTFRSLTVRFTATGDDGTIGRATRYDVRVSQAPITNDAQFASATQLTGEPIPAMPGTLETFRLTGLEPSRLYYVAVRATDNAGNPGALSNVVSFSTGRAAVLLEDNVEGGPRDWTVDGTDGTGGPALWQITRSTLNNSKVWSFSNSGYTNGARNWAMLTSRELDLTQARDARLRFTQYIWTQRHYAVDMAQVQVSADGGAWTTLLSKNFSAYGEVRETIDLAPYDGHRIKIRFSIDTLNDPAATDATWQVDDIIIDATSTNAPPAAVIDGIVTPTEDQPIVLSSAGSSDPEGAPLEFKWDFGDGTYAYTRSTSVTHTWTRAGSYTMTLTAYDGSNASDPYVRAVPLIPVNDRPVAVIDMRFAPPPHLEETGILVTYFGSSDEELSPLTCRFDYGDGETTAQPCSGSWTHAWNRPGTYTITLVVNDGQLDSLPATQPITILENSNDAPIARPGGPYSTRPNQPVTLDGSASSDEETSIASYLWTFADASTSTVAQPTKTFPTPGTQNVSLSVTDQTGRTSQTATTQIRVCGGTIANLFGSTVYTCPGGTARVGVNVSNGLLPLTLTWSDGFTQQVTQLSNEYYAERIVTPAAPTTYALASVTDSGGCAGTVGTTTTPVDFASVTVSGTYSICPGQSRDIYPTLRGDGPWTLTWSDGYVQSIPLSGPAPHRTVTPGATTVYSIASATCASCPSGTAATTSGTVTINVLDPISGTVSGGGTSCNGTSVAITATIVGGAPPFNVAWSDGVNFGTSTRTATRFVHPTITTTYTAQVSSASCSAPASGSATITVWNGATPSVTDVTGGGTLCPGQSATITATLAGDGLPFTLTWSDGFVQTTNTLSASRSVSPASMTTYAVSSIVNANGCSGTVHGNATVWRTTPPAATVSGGGTFCSGGSSVIRAVLEGRAPFAITWSDGFSETVPSNSTVRSMSPTSATTYTITSISDSLCGTGTASGSATATPLARPSATVSGGGSFCAGSSQQIAATLTGTAPFQLTWSDGFTQTVANGTEATRTVSPSALTTYTIASFSDANCSGIPTGSATVTPIAAAKATVTGGGPFCAGATTTIAATLTGTAPFTLVWSDGFTQTVSGTSAARQVSPAATTTYTITSISGAGCNGTSSGSAAATRRNPPTATVSGTATYCEGSTTPITAALTGVAPFSVTWSDGVTQSIASGTTATRQVAPAVQTVYTVTALSDSSCSGTATGSATVTPTLSPVITTQPQSKTIKRNSTATLTVTASGTANNYQWYIGASGTTTTPVGTNAPSFTTPKLSANTQYWVKIWKSGCTASPTNSQTATITVN